MNVWRSTANLLENEGVVIKKINLPHSKHVGATYMVLNSAEVASNFSCYDGIEFGHRANEYVNEEGQLVKFRTAGELFEASRTVFGSNVKSRILAGNYFLLTPKQEMYLRHAMKVRRLIYQDFQSVFKGLQKINEERNVNYMRANCGGNYPVRDTDGKDMNRNVGISDANRDINCSQNDDSVVDFILTPATLNCAVTISEWRRRSDNQQQAIKEDYFTTGPNLAGLPAVTFPVKLSRNGMPLSLQLIGNHFTDLGLLSVVNQIQNMVYFPFLKHRT